MEGSRGRAPTIRDVARVAGVSYQTVSRMLNGRGAVRESTRERIADAIAELGFRPNHAAQALATSRSRTIGVLGAETAYYGPSTSITAIERAARAAGYRVSMTTAGSGDFAALRSAIDHLMGQSIDALVVIAPQAAVLEAIRDLGVAIPYVALEALGAGDDSGVQVDQVAGAQRVVRHLVELGHRDMLHLAGPQDWIEAASRRQGWEEALHAAGLPVRPPLEGDWTAASGYRLGPEALRSGATAVFCGNDQMALGLLHAARDLGVAVPAELSVVGFDDIPEAEHFSPALTTVRQDFAEVGRRAIAWLLHALRGETVEPGRMIAPELVVRATTAPPAR